VVGITQDTGDEGRDKGYINDIRGYSDMKRILLVEDDEHLQFLIKEELAEVGYEVMTASDGVEAMSMLQAEGVLSPDLIILDIRMPRMDGFETMGHLLKSKIDSPIIIHSAYSGYKNHPLTMAADAYIVKSHNFSELKETIRELLGLRDLPDTGASLAQAV
jgi:DNA-binding response OmpR family regulator